MTAVDPYVINIPRFISTASGEPSPEFLQWLIYDNRFKHDLWQAVTGGTGGATTPGGGGGSSGGSMPSITARLAFVEEQLDDDPFTIDSTGWTVDTTMITVDMSKA